MTTAIAVLRAGRPEHTPECELASVEVHDDRVVVVLDDGETLDFDAGELRAAMGERVIHRRAA